MPDNLTRQSDSAVSRRARRIQRLWKAARAPKSNAETPTLLRLKAIRRLLQMGELPTVEPLLPLFFSLRGKPYELKNHAVFSPMFRLTMPKRSMYKTGRQVGKSTDISAAALVKATCIPNYVSLFVCPRFEQSRRLSGNFIRPFIDQSPLRELWIDTNTEKSVLQRSFTNNSKLIFSFALLDADRVRGVSADHMSIDELQDMLEEHIPVIREALSASPWATEQFTGTPKSLSNPIERFWLDSSQAEWFIPCMHCRFVNIPCKEYHAEAMIGPAHEDISEKCPGTLCYRCRKPINPRHGFWKHRYPERMHTFAGYHISQIIMPLHFNSPSKWADLCLKQQGGVQTSAATFWNEVMGESYDTGSRLLTLTDLQAAASLPWENNYRDPAAAVAASKAAGRKYQETILAIDWGGGGEERVSYTTLAYMGYTPSGKIDVIWGIRLLTPNDHIEEAARVIAYINQLRPNMVVHDATGAGKLRETLLLATKKVPPNMVHGFELTGGGKALVKYVPADQDHPRPIYRIDKTRTLQYTIAAIRMGILQFFKWDRKGDRDPGLLWDFLALVEEKSDTRFGADTYAIRREVGQSDDFAQAVNLGCVAFWHKGNRWPDLYKEAARNKGKLLIADRLRAAVELSDEQLKLFGHDQYGWEDVPKDELEREQGPIR